MAINRKNPDTRIMKKVPLISESRTSQRKEQPNEPVRFNVSGFRAFGIEGFGFRGWVWGVRLWFQD